MDHERARPRLIATASLLAALALLLGVPAALATFIGWPLPTRAPSLGAIRDAFDRGDVDPQVLIKALAVVVWVAWAQLAWAIVIEAIAHARGQVARARAVLPGTQLFARQLVASAALVFTAFTPARGSVAAPLHAVTVAAAEAASTASAPPTATRAPTASAEPARRAYSVQDGDSWWGLAQRFLGSGTRWREVRDLNTGRQVAPGRTLIAGDDTLLAGWTIAVPGDATVPPRPAAATPGDRVVAQPGDDLWSLATDRLTGALGREPSDEELGEYWQATLEANTGPGLADPNVIAVGQELVLPPTAAMTDRAAASPAAPGPLVVTVTAGDSPWRIAQAHLGDGQRWPELLEANRDRVQPDGRTWDDPGTFLPGWQLVIPPTGEASTPVPAPPVPAVPPAPAPVPAPRQPAAPAGTEAGEPADEPGPLTSSTTAPPLPHQGDTPGDRSRRLPEPPEATTAAAPTSTSTPTASPPSTSAGPAAPGSRAPTEEDDDGGTPAAPVLGVAGTVLAVALLRSLRRRRGCRAAQLPVAVVPPPPPRAAQPVAREVLGSEDEPAVDRLDAALAHLAAQLRPRGGEPCPQPRLVQLTGERIEVLLDRADPAPPAPWRPEASGQVWALDSNVEVARSDAASPLPALVTIGAGDADILIDLEAFGIVSLVGNPDACAGLARSMVTELAARAEGALGIDVVGLDDPHIGGLDGVRAVASWDEVDTGLIGASARMLDAGRWPHTFAARASGRVFDGWAPAVFITAHTEHTRYHSAIEQVGTRPGAGSAIVVTGADQPLGYGIRINLSDDGQFHIPELGLTGHAQQLADKTVEQVIDLLEDAGHVDVAQTFDFPTDDPADVAHADGAQDAHPEPATPLAPPGLPYQDPDWDVLVRVCGEIHVEGGKDRLPAREAAVATYIALNRNADIDQVRDAVWAGADVSRKRVQNVVSNVRRTLGDAIYFVDEGRLAAGPGLVTDLELVQRRLAYARHQDDHCVRAETLRDALSWATGKACTYPSTARRAWAWIDYDNWISNIESVIGTVAHELATLYLELGDSTGATWAARRGLDATGPREQLTLLLVRGYELAGDVPAAADTLRSYERHMEELGADEHSEALLAAMDRYVAPKPGRAAS